MNAPAQKPASVTPWLALAGLAAAFFFVVWYKPLNLPREAGTAHPAAGKRLPPMTLTALTGTVDDVTLPDKEYKAVVLNFWGTWCPPCREELPHLVSLAKSFKGEEGFKFVAVSCTSGGEPEDTPELSAQTLGYLSQTDMQISTYADVDLSARRAVNGVAGFSGYPTTIVLDGDNTIRGMWTGYDPSIKQQIEMLAASLLRE